MAKITFTNAEMKSALAAFGVSSIRPVIHDAPSREFRAIHAIVEDCLTDDPYRKIDLNPSFQRAFVWDRERQDRLLNTIMEGGTIPMILMGKEKSKTGKPTANVCVDGKQRLTTVMNFVMGKSRIRGIFKKTDDGVIVDPSKIVNRYIGKCFKDIERDDPLMAEKIRNYQLEIVTETCCGPLDMTELFIRHNCGAAKMQDCQILYSKYENTPAAKTVMKFLHTEAGRFMANIKRVRNEESARAKNFQTISEYVASADNFINHTGFAGADMFYFEHENKDVTDLVQRLEKAHKTFLSVFGGFCFYIRRVDKDGTAKTHDLMLSDHTKTKQAVIAALCKIDDHSKIIAHKEHVRNAMSTRLNATTVSNSLLFDCLTVQTSQVGRRMTVQKLINEALNA